MIELTLDLTNFLDELKLYLDTQSALEQEVSAQTNAEILAMLGKIDTTLLTIQELIALVIGCIVVFFVFRFLYGYFSSLFRG
jgi:hypothetical protein